MQYTAFLRWALIVGLFTIPFISLIVAMGGWAPAMFFPYITGKNFAFRILVWALLGIYAILALKDPRYRPRSSLLMWTALAFIVWMGIATMFSVDPVKSFWSNFERMEGYVGLLHLFAFFVIVGAVLTAENLWERFLQTSVGASLLQGFIALFQVLGWMGFAPSSQSGSRADGTFGNAIYLAVFLLVNFFITLYLLAKLYGERKRLSVGLQIFYGLALVLQTIGIFATQTRGAMLGLFVGLVIAALYVLWQAKGAEWRMARRVSLGILVVVVALGSMVFAFRDSATIQAVPGISRLASITLEETTVVSRLFYIWPMALEGAMERPITGWGQENFNFIFNKHYEPGMYNQEEWFDRAHNQFLDWLIAGGVLAFLLYLSFYILAAWVIYRAEGLRVPEQAALFGLLAAFGFHNLFVFDNLMSAVYFFTILAFVHAISRRQVPGFLFLSRPVGDRGIAIAAPIVALMVIFSAYQLNAAGIVRAQTLFMALQPDTGLSASLESFERALGQGSLGQQEVVEQLVRFAAAVASSDASPELKERAYTLARSAAEKFIASHPGDARVELIYSSLLASYGQLGEALERLEIARASSPRKQRVLFQTALVLIHGGAVEEAVSLLKQAFESEPRFDEARIRYAGGLYYAGRKQEADALLEERFGTTLVDDEYLLGVYADTRQFGRVIDIWQGRVEQNPESPDARMGLASAYFNANRLEESIAELEQVARLNSALAPRVKSIIGQIRDGTLRP